MKLNFGNQIRLNRRRMNLTQEQLAEKFGTSPQAISRWEIGATYPDIEMLPMIASFFETSVDSLLGVTEEEKEKRCSELQKSFEIAVRAKAVRKTVEIMREIRRNLKDYQQYGISCPDFFDFVFELSLVRILICSDTEQVVCGYRQKSC